jgi:hypothetical protein
MTLSTVSVRFVLHLEASLFGLKTLEIQKKIFLPQDPDSMTLWIRIRIGNPDSGSRGKNMKKNKYFFS